MKQVCLRTIHLKTFNNFLSILGAGGEEMKGRWVVFLYFIIDCFFPLTSWQVVVFDDFGKYWTQKCCPHSGQPPRLHYNFNETFLHVLDQIFKTNKQAKKQANPACTARILPFWHLLNVSKALKISLARAKPDSSFSCITPLPDHSPVHSPGEWHYHGHLWQLFLVPIFQCSC